MTTQTLWLDKLADRWPVARIKDHVALINGFPFDSACFSQMAGVRLVRIRDLTDGGELTYVDTEVPESAMIDSGDLVVGMDGDFKVMVWNGGPAALNQRLCVLRARPSLDQRFLGYLLAMPLKAINATTFFTTVKHLSSSDLLGERIPLPPLSTQRAIANYLDGETAQLDGLAFGKRRMVELLKERQSELVTDLLLGPPVPSGGAGPGQLTARPGWSRVPFRRLFREIDSRSATGSETLLSVSQTRGVVPQSELGDRRQYAETLVGYKRCARGDLVVNRMWVYYAHSAPRRGRESSVPTTPYFGRRPRCHRSSPHMCSVRQPTSVR